MVCVWLSTSLSKMSFGAVAFESATDSKSVVQVDGLGVFRGFSNSMLHSLYDGLPVRRRGRRTGSPSYKLSESTAFVVVDGLEVRRTS
jgi:hypothetical protein